MRYAKSYGHHYRKYSPLFVNFFEYLLILGSLISRSHLNLALDGVEIIANPSGSHHQLRKADRRVNLIKSATSKCGGIYLFSNQRGCDGDRLYFDGCATIAINGDFVCQGEQFSLKEVEVLTAVLDIDQVHSYRNRIRSFQVMAEKSTRFPRINVDFSLCVEDNLMTPCSSPIPWKYHDPMEEIA